MSIMPSKEELDLKLATIKHEAEHKSKHETAQFVGLARFCHHMACQNNENQLKPSVDGGIKIPPTMLSQLAVGFATDGNEKPVFCVFFQEYLWEIVKYLPLEGMILEKNEQSVKIQFKEILIGEYKVPALSLSMPINSHAIWDKLNSGQIQKCTLAGMKRSIDNDELFYCHETQADPAPFLQQYYAVKKQHALF